MKFAQRLNEKGAVDEKAEGSTLLAALVTVDRATEKAFAKNRGAKETRFASKSVIASTWVTSTTT